MRRSIIQSLSIANVSKFWCASLACVLALSASGSGLFDVDGDSFADAMDNCVNVFNEDQRDTDNDGIGNACDADLNQDCVVNFLDIAQVSVLFLSSDDNADVNGDGEVNFLDYIVYANSFGMAPGPSGLPNLCSPSVSLTLEGATGPVPLVGGAVSAVLDQTGAGGGVQVFNALANADGTFEIVLNDVNPTDFVTLAAVGLGGQTGVSLTSLAGSIQRLSLLGGSDGTVNFIQASTLELTPVSTAFSVLASEANGTDVSSDAELAGSDVAVDASELLELAAIIDAIVVDPDVILPSGITDTVTLASDLDDRQDFRVRLYAEQALNLEAAISRVISLGNSPFVAADLVGTQRVSYLNNLLSFGGAELEFGAGNAVTFRGELTSTASWTLEPGGNVEVIFTTPQLTGVGTVTIEDPNNPGVFVQAEQSRFLSGVTMSRVREGADADTIVFTRQGFSNFSDFPELGNTPTGDLPGTRTARLLVADSVTVPFSPLELAGSGLAVNYAHQLNAAQGVGGDLFLGFDTLDFVADGTGQSRRRGFAFDWNILANGELNVVFANGDSNRFRRLFGGEDGTSIGQVTYEIAGQDQVLRRTFFVPRDETAEFSDTSVENKTYRSSVANTATFSLPDLSVFDFVVSPGAEACRNPDSSVSSWAWTVQDQRLEFFRDFGGAIDLFFSRTWQPLRIVGDRYWVIETLQIDSTDVPVVDPSVTPGRINTYTLTHDASGNSRPTLNADSYTTTVDTPIIIYLSDLLGNDVDPEGDQIIYRSLLPVAAAGTITQVIDSTVYPYAFRYEPPAGFTGVETFELAASDIACRGALPIPTSTLTITVN